MELQKEMDRVSRMQREFTDNFNKKVDELTITYQNCLQELKRDYDGQIGELNQLHKKISKNHQQVCE
jgi:predicted nucleotidyltransferase